MLMHNRRIDVPEGAVVRKLRWSGARTGTEKGDLVPAIGYEITLDAMPDFRFFVDERSEYLELDDEMVYFPLWVVSEISSGAMLACGESRSEAIDRASATLRRVGRDLFVATVQKVLAEYGDAQSEAA